MSISLIRREIDLSLTAAVSVCNALLSLPPNMIMNSLSIEIDLKPF